MRKVKEFERQKPPQVHNDEDEATLAAIDEGIHDADAGRTTPAEEVRKLLPKLTTAFSTQKGR
jgi:predicted transcriptional regulator